MGNRTKSKDRCPKCNIRSVLCICNDIPQFDLKTKLIVLIHNRETRRPTNTGRLATLALKNSEMRVRGKRGDSMSELGLVVPDRQSLLLYPSDDAVELSQEMISCFKRPITLIVPDGSWRQASKVSFREPSLFGIPRIKLPEGNPTEYRLRKESKINGLSTFEAIARAFGIIENPEIQTKLEDFFRMFVERVLWSRAQLKTEDCKYQIPAKALEQQSGRLE